MDGPMLRALFRKRIIAALVAAGIAIHLASCGTILHPERRGQPAGRLDPGIVVLDAVGLIFFFVPGIIAFAVDFSNGTIYLPPEHSAGAAPTDGQELRKVRMSSEQLTPQRLEAVIHEQTGRTIHLEPGAYQASKLNQIGEFSSVNREHLQSSLLPVSVKFSAGPNVE